MDFDVLIDDTLNNLGLGVSHKFPSNHWLSSVINDFEDGKWRRRKFNNFVWDNIAETALTKTERDAYIGRPNSLLSAAARNLRLTDADEIGKGSELAEIFLYGILRHKYQALSAVPKIFYKQNSKDNAKGADSVHIVLGGPEDYSLWFGEAKFYNSIEDARLDSIIDSVKNSLDTDKLKKENRIITNLSELDHLGIEVGLVKKIRTGLNNEESIDNIKHLINIPILIVNECSRTASASKLDSSYLKEIKKFHSERAEAFFKKQEKKLASIHLIEKIKFHLILFPVPEKGKIVDEFVRAVEFHKSNGMDQTCQTKAKNSKKKVKETKGKKGK